MQGPPSFHPLWAPPVENGHLYLYLWPNSSQDSGGRSHTGIHPFVFRDLHTKIWQMRQITMQIPLWTKKKILFCRTFNLATIKSVSLSLKDVNIATRGDKAVLFVRTLLFIPTTERSPRPGPTPPIDPVDGSSIRTTDNNSLGTPALPFLQHPASEQTAAVLPVLQGQPACAQSREQGLGEHCPQGPRSWFSLHKQPLPHQHSSFSQVSRVYTHSLWYSEQNSGIQQQKNSCSSQLVVCSQSCCWVTALVTELLKNTDCNSPFLQLQVRTPRLQPYPHSQWNRNSLKGVGLADSPAVECYGKFSVIGWI